MRDALEGIAQHAASVGLRRVSFGVSESATESIAALPHATAREVVYLETDGRTYVIRTAEVNLGGVHFQAQDSRPALAADFDGADLREHRIEAYRAARVAR